MWIKACDHHVLPWGLGIYKFILKLPGEDNSSMACIQPGAKYILLNVKSKDSCLDLSGGDHRSSTSPTVVFVYHCARLTQVVIGFPPHGGANQQVINIFNFWSIMYQFSITVGVQSAEQWQLSHQIRIWVILKDWWCTSKWRQGCCWGTVVWMVC